MIESIRHEDGDRKSIWFVFWSQSSRRLRFAVDFPCPELSISRGLTLIAQYRPKAIF